MENAFKHGVSNDKPSHIVIDLHEIDSQLICRIENSCFPKTAESDRSGSGIGLQNLSRRLEMIYPGRYTFEYGSADDVFRALLCINLSES